MEFIIAVAVGLLGLALWLNYREKSASQPEDRTAVIKSLHAKLAEAEAQKEALIRDNAALHLELQNSADRERQGQNLVVQLRQDLGRQQAFGQAHDHMEAELETIRQAKLAELQLYLDGMRSIRVAEMDAELLLRQENALQASHQEREESLIQALEDKRQRLNNELDLELEQKRRRIEYNLSEWQAKHKQELVQSLDNERAKHLQQIETELAPQRQALLDAVRNEVADVRQKALASVEHEVVERKTSDLDALDAEMQAQKQKAFDDVMEWVEREKQRVTAKLERELKRQVPGAGLNGDKA